MSEELNLTPVNSANDSSSDFKLRWYPSQDKFKISSTLFGQLGLAEKGLQQFNGENGVFLGVRKDENSVFMRKKKDYNKGREFKNKNLSNALKDYKFPSEPDYVDLNVKYMNTVEMDGEEFPVYKIYVESTTEELGDKPKSSFPGEDKSKVDEAISSRRQETETRMNESQGIGEQPSEKVEEESKF